ncbi:MAG: hypothetical protein KDB53_09575 [Planctomycetes bacterium]|nr:hypothetical protein [Planctomycetota bacterium]
MTRTGSNLMTLLIVGFVVQTLGAQYSISKVQEPDRYALAPELPYLPRYERDDDERLIKNADYFCTSCAKEGRIAAKTRNDMKEILETVKVYPSAVDGRTHHPAGRFRLMDENAEHVLRFLFEELDTTEPIFIEDGMFRLFMDLPGTVFPENQQPRRARELEELRDVFPELSPTATRLNAHHRAHLYLVRAHRVRRDFEFIVNHDPRASYMDYGGPYLGNLQKFAMFYFRDKGHLRSFVRSFVGNYPDPDGVWHNSVKDVGLSLAAFIQHDRDPWVNNVFTHRLAMALLLGYRRFTHYLPAWFVIGFGHVMERRERTDYNTFIAGKAPLPSSPWRDSDWKVAVKKRLKSNKYPHFGVGCRHEEIGAIPFADRPLCWSQVSYLMQLDLEKFGRFIHWLKQGPKAGEDPYVVQKAGLKAIYDIEIEDFEAQWREWVMQTY